MALGDLIADENPLVLQSLPRSNGPGPAAMLPEGAPARCRMLGRVFLHAQEDPASKPSDPARRSRRGSSQPSRNWPQTSCTHYTNSGQAWPIIGTRGRRGQQP